MKAKISIFVLSLHFRLVEVPLIYHISKGEKKGRTTHLMIHLNDSGYLELDCILTGNGLDGGLIQAIHEKAK